MKVSNVAEGKIDGVDYYFIYQDDRYIFTQRRGLRSASESPMSYNDDLICALCEKIISFNPTAKSPPMPTAQD